MKRRRWLTACGMQLAACSGFAIGLGGTLGGLGGCAAPIRRLAFLGGLTGRAADLGVGGRDGVQLAVEQASAQGQPWQLDVYDDQQDPARAQEALRAAAAAGHRLVVGPMTSSIAVALLPLAAELDVLLLSPTVTTNELSRRQDHFFRIVSSVDQYARSAAEYFAGHTALRRFAILRDDGNRAYSQTWAQGFGTQIARHGGQVVDEQAYVFSPSLALPAVAQRALASRPDAVLLICNAVDAARLAQALRKFAPALPVLTSEWSATEEFLTLGGAAVEGITLTQFLDRDSRAPRYLAFRDAFRERFGRSPGFAAAAGYDAATIALRALREQGSGESVAATLLRLREFEGLQQTLAFDGWGEAARPVYMTRVSGGRFVLVQ